MHKRIITVTICSFLMLLGHGVAQAEEGFTPIFNGKDLDGWDGEDKFWRVEDGVIVGETTAENRTQKNTFLIWDQGEVDDFELKFRYRIVSEKANSGVQVRSERLEGYVVRGYQPDIADVGWITGIHYEERGRGILARRGQRAVFGDDGSKEVTRFAEEADLGEHIKGRNQWNDYHVIARGNTIITKINGKKMHEVVDDSPQARRSGILAFQLHTGPPMTLHFKDIALKRLKLDGDRKKAVFVAGHRSHGYGAHEHKAGCMLLAEHLNEHVPQVLATVYSGGWPADPTAFDNADAVVIYANGGDGHPAIRHKDQFEGLVEAGVGVVLLHWATGVPCGEVGKQWVDWVGANKEPNWSVNPFWTLRDAKLGDHPITQGVSPFSINDEWYYHLRFRENMDRTVAILSAHPPKESLSRKDGAFSGNPDVRAAVLDRKEIQHVAWAAEHGETGRSFGFTGGHWHWNWGHPMHRRIVLNGIIWAAGAEVSESGVPTPALTMDDLKANQDYPVPDNFDFARWEKLLNQWNDSSSE